MGKLAVLLILGAALAMGAGLYYAQTRGYYAAIEGPVTLTLETDTGLVAIPATEVQAIASNASPLGFRACFAHGLDLAAAVTDLAPIPAIDPAPTIAPPWFDCFDAGAVDALIGSEAARSFVAYKNVAFGVDRLVTLTARRPGLRLEPAQRMRCESLRRYRRRGGLPDPRDLRAPDRGKPLDARSAHRTLLRGDPGPDAAPRRRGSARSS